MASCFDLARLPDALIKSARTATFVVAVASTLTPHEIEAQSQSSSVRSTWVRFQPGDRNTNGFADASIGIKYVTRECFGRVGLLIDLNPLFFRTTSVYWFNGQRMNVPQNVSVQAPSSVPVSGQIAGLIRGPSTFATDVTRSGMSCVDGVQLGKFEEYWDTKTVT